MFELTVESLYLINGGDYENEKKAGYNIGHAIADACQWVGDKVSSGWNWLCDTVSGWFN